MEQETTLLGFDVGRVKTGVARSFGPLAEPLLVIREKNPRKLARKIAVLAKKEGATTVVLGLPTGKLVPYIEGLENLISQEGLSVAFYDETLTTKDAQNLALSAHMPKERRQALEDAFSATLMLQSYLDNNV